MNFIICADARTGSHMLQTALNNHPKITCYGEILNPRSKDSLLKGRGFIEAIDFAFKSAHNAGFILHRCVKYTPEVWQYIYDNKHIKIIVLDRLNPVQRYASHKLAKKTKRFIDFKGVKPTETIEFDPAEYIDYVARTAKNMVEALKFFENHHKEIVLYSFLLGEFEKTFKKICRFLKVTEIVTEPTTKKQETRQLCEIFSNYNDFKSLFKHYDN